MKWWEETAKEREELEKKKLPGVQYCPYAEEVAGELVECDCDDEDYQDCVDSI